MQADLRALLFYAYPISYTSGQVISTRATHMSINEDVVQAIQYRYQVNQLSRIGQSYSSNLVARPDTLVEVEYLSSQPEYARITGTSSAVLPLEFALIFAIVFSGAGSCFVFVSIRCAQKLLAVIEDAVATEATCWQLKDRKDPEYKTYEAHYRYYFNGCEHNYLFETSEVTRFGIKEIIIFQRADPTNAVLQASLPAFIQENLRPLKL
jgi:hypothetical protein